MITINLLDATPTRESSQAFGSFRPVVSIVAVVVVAAALAGTWVALAGERAHLRTMIATAAGLGAALGDQDRVADTLIVRRAELLERASLIAYLTANGSSAFALLALVAEALPDGLWLAELSKKGDRLEISGRATSIAAVALFAQNLRDSNVATGDVDIRSASAEVFERVPLFRFEIVAGLE